MHVLFKKANQKINYIFCIMSYEVPGHWTLILKFDVDCQIIVKLSRERT